MILSTANKAAQEQNIALEIRITADKAVRRIAGCGSRGASRRRGRVYGELDAVPENQLLSDQRGMPLEPPVVVLVAQRP